MKTTIIILSTMLLASEICFSQVVNKKEKATFIEGQIGLSTGKDILCLNIGGPKFYLVKSEKIQVSLGFYPTIRYGVTSKKVVPALGVGPEIGLGSKIGLIVPVYWSAPDNWIPTYGIRYKF